MRTDGSGGLAGTKQCSLPEISTMLPALPSSGTDDESSEKMDTSSAVSPTAAASTAARITKTTQPFFFFLAGAAWGCGRTLWGSGSGCT